MKTRLTIGMGVMAAALFVLVPNAESKHGGGPPAGLIPLSGSCTDVEPDVLGGTNSCTLAAISTASLSTRLSYKLEFVTSCGFAVGGAPVTLTALSTGATFTVQDVECGGGTWTVNLWSSNTKGDFGSGATQVGTGLLIFPTI